MSELLSALKLFVIASLIIIGLQVKWNGMSLEKHALMSLHQSTIGQTLEDVAMGAVKASRQGYAWAKSKINPSSEPAEQKASR